MNHLPNGRAIPDGSAGRRRLWMRRGIWVAGGILALMVVVYFVGGWLAAPLLRSKLHGMVESRLNARLEMGTVRYRFPLGVTVTDAVLVAEEAGQRVELLKVPRLSIALAKLPFGSGPLVIRSLDLTEPAVHLIRTESGWVGQHTLIRADAAPGASTGATPGEVRRKLSEMFELRSVKVTGAQVVYEDRSQTGSQPQVWKQINLNMTTEPKADPIYTFDFSAGGGSMADLGAKGTFDIDELVLNVERGSMHFRVDPAEAQSTAPPAMQQILRDNQVKGSVDVEGKLLVSLRRPKAARFDATIDLKEVEASFPDADLPIRRVSMKVYCSTQALNVRQDLVATAIRLRREDAATRPSTQPATAVAQTRPSTEPTTVAAMTQPSTQPAAALYMVVQKMSAIGGDTRITIDEAAISLDWDTWRWILHDAHGQVILGNISAAMPDSLDTAARTTDLYGTIDLIINGGGSLRKSNGERDFHLAVHASGEHIYGTSRRLLLNNVRCDLNITPTLLSIAQDESKQPGLSGEFYGGALTADGYVQLKKPIHYSLEGKVRDADLKSLAEAWAREGEKPTKLSGVGSARINLSGDGRHDGHSARESVKGDGAFWAHDGNFYALPVINGIVQQISAGDDAATVGRAAGVFTLAGDKLEFKKIAVSSPLLGLQGSGTATLDGGIDFKAVAVPLADWKRQIEKANIPIVSDVVGGVAGGVQKLLNTATGKLLYQFHITGNVGDPVIATEPAPILSDDAARLFGAMLKGGGDLLDEISK